MSSDDMEPAEYSHLNHLHAACINRSIDYEYSTLNMEAKTIDNIPKI